MDDFYTDLRDQFDIGGVEASYTNDGMDVVEEFVYDDMDIDSDVDCTVHVSVTDKEVISAVLVDDVGVLRDLLARGGNANATTSEETALHISSRAVGDTCAKILVSHGANVLRTDKFGRIPLCIALTVNNIDVIKLLHPTGSIPSTNTDRLGWTPMHYALAFSSPAILHYMTENGYISQLFLHDKCGDIPMDNIILYGRINLFREHLQTHGADRIRSIVTANRGSLLHVAARRSRMAISRILIDVVGIFVDRRTIHGETPLFLACTHAHRKNLPKYIRFLLRRNADVLTRDIDGNTLVHAVAIGTSETNNIGRRLAYITEQTCDDANALTSGFVGELASRLVPSGGAGNGSVLRLLIRKGVSLYHTNNMGYSPIHSAARAGQYNTLKFLLREAQTLHELNPCMYLRRCVYVNIKNLKKEVAISTAIESIIYDIQQFTHRPRGRSARPTVKGYLICISLLLRAESDVPKKLRGLMQSLLKNLHYIRDEDGTSKEYIQLILTQIMLRTGKMKEFILFDMLEGNLQDSIITSVHNTGNEFSVVDETSDQEDDMTRQQDEDSEDDESD